MPYKWLSCPQPSCLKFSLPFQPYFSATSTDPFILPAASSATLSVKSLQLCKSFLNLHFRQRILIYCLAWVTGVPGPCLFLLVFLPSVGQVSSNTNPKIWFCVNKELWTFLHSLLHTMLRSSRALWFLRLCHICVYVPTENSEYLVTVVLIIL